MNTILWFLQALMAITFMYSGVCKSIMGAADLVAKGQTGVENMPLPFIKFIGISEILGAIGLILPQLLNVLPVLSVAAAFGFTLIMIPAAVIHYRRREYKTVAGNMVLLVICLFIAFGRICLLG